MGWESWWWQRVDQDCLGFTTDHHDLQAQTQVCLACGRCMSTGVQTINDLRSVLRLEPRAAGALADSLEQDPIVLHQSAHCEMCPRN